LALRAAEPDLRDADLAAVHVDYDEAAGWVVVHRGGYRVAANLAETEQRVPVAGGEVVLATGRGDAARPTADGLTLGPQSAAIVRL
jgi:maltooligosyltrehalose trehalohydrolase